MNRRSRILQKRSKKQLSNAVLGSLSPYQIILRPIITEKGLQEIDNKRTYHFVIHSGANRNDVKKSIEYIYNVKPRSVRTMNVPFKGRMQRKLVRRSFKKAMVTLHDGDSIELVS